MQEMPSIASSVYGTSTSTYNDLAQMAAQGSLMPFVGRAQVWDPNQQADSAAREALAARRFQAASNQVQQEKKAVAEKSKRRLVQVFIADPNENIPLDESVIYQGGQKLTDSTDQELFFEVDIRGILEKHNEKRVKLVDKKVKERVEHLEPARVRDLKMVVVTIAEF